MRHTQTPDDRQNALPVRPRELQDSLNFYLYHPSARRLAMRLVNTPVTPNMVSIIGGLFVVAAAIVYAQSGSSLTALIGLMLHMLWHVFDGADGDLARLTNQASPTGELIDGICDYTAHIILYLILAWLISPIFGWGGLMLAALAGASRVVQANHYENRRRHYEFLVYGRRWMQSEPLAKQQGMGRAFNWIETGYLAIAETMAGKADDLIIMHEQCGKDPQKLSTFRNAILRFVKPTLGPLSMLGANHRTIVLGLSMLAGTPVYFFAYEIVFLNIILLWMMAHYKTTLGKIVNELAHGTDERSASSLR
jgi:phosphatidylglycerophosphate synthase